MELELSGGWRLTDRVYTRTLKQPSLRTYGGRGFGVGGYGGPTAMGYGASTYGVGVYGT